MCRGDEFPLSGYSRVYMYKLIATTKFEKIEEENKPKVEQALKYFSVQYELGNQMA